MKVRILSGNAKGQLLEMDRTEAEVNIATGYAEAVLEEPKLAVAPKEKPARVPPKPRED